MGNPWRNSPLLYTGAIFNLSLNMLDKKFSFSLRSLLHSHDALGNDELPLGRCRIARISISFWKLPLNDYLLGWISRQEMVDYISGRSYYECRLEFFLFISNILPISRKIIIGHSKNCHHNVAETMQIQSQLIWPYNDEKSYFYFKLINNWQ